MPIAFHNTMTRNVEEFKPITPGKVTMYTCGPTVYDYFHIGNARSFVMADVIRRYFEFRGYDVKFVMNITDIDDKIIKRALERDVASADIALEYTKAFLEDLAKLGVREATEHPRATDNIPDIIGHISGLIAQGAAYELEGDVYFEVSRFPEYGKLSGKNLDDLQAGARVEADTRKRSPMDFALWKSAKPGEPSWESPWGNGRPGWHIECSVMAGKYLGVPFDIHAGGNDLIFPHHENEIAQSEALTHKTFAKAWLHFGFLNIDNEKMSKSLGNFFTTRDILEKVSAEALRYLYLQTHYRSPLNFTAEGLEACGRGLHKLQKLYNECGGNAAGPISLDVAPYRTRFEEAVDNDFNFPAGIAVLFDLARDAAAASAQGGLDTESAAAIRGFLAATARDVFGVINDAPGKRDDELTGKLMDAVIAIRAKARSEKMWQFSDFIRDELAGIGIKLLDGKEGTTWTMEE
jgi:cysteinyl-tRNA synthetase